MYLKRSGGVLLHPTSLPGPYGIGDIGPEAHRWVDFLADAGCGLWQVLPHGPTGYGDSPYQCFSAFAGNPLLISPDALLADGLLQPADLADMPAWPEGRVDFGALIPWKLSLLDRAYRRFVQSATPALRREFADFLVAEAAWLDDFALFMALKEAHGGVSWSRWPTALRSRQPDALAEARRQRSEAIQRQAFRQWLFFRQWADLRRHAHARKIQIIGDIPIFVAHDSADVWANPHLFELDAALQPTLGAGVPPDYFSPTGQLWGNPLYRWEAHAADGYAWWLQRCRAVLQVADIIRIDHFRGFCAYWAVPAGSPTAEHGEWKPGPAEGFFRAMLRALGDLPFIAEDLGEITPDVFALRDKFGLPGMKILQFAFSGDPDEPFLPHNFPTNCIAYTGTHDNDTSIGWYQSAPANEQDCVRRYLGRDGSEVAWDFVRAVWSSVAVYALAPLQDLLALGPAARLNYPGRPYGNWGWRMADGALSAALQDRLLELNWLFGRVNKEKPPKSLSATAAAAAAAGALASGQ